MKRFTSLYLFALVALILSAGCAVKDDSPSYIPPVGPLSSQIDQPNPNERPWFDSYRKPELVPEIKLSGVTFLYPDTISDLRLDGMLLAYGAEQRKYLAPMAVDIFVEETYAKDDNPREFILHYKDKRWHVTQDENFEQRAALSLMEISDAFKKSGDRATPASPEREPSDKTWYMAYYSPRQSRNIDLRDVKFIYVRAESDWRLDGPLQAYGAIQTDRSEEADMVVTRESFEEEAKRKDVSGVFTVKYKGETYKLPEYWDFMKYNREAEKLLKELTKLRNSTAAPH